MNLTNNNKEIMEKIINILFSILIIGIIIGTIFVDRKIDYSHINNLSTYNCFFYLIAAVFISLVLFFGYKTREYALEKKQWIITTFIIAFIFVAFQTVICKSFPVFMGTDFEYVRKAAISMAESGGLDNRKYFMQFPNNLNIVTVFALLYKVFKKWRVVMLFMSLSINIAMVLISMTVVKITKSRKTGILTLFIGEMLVALAFRSFVPYTDGMGILFAAIVIYLYFSNLRYKLKMPLIILFGMIGTYIKVTFLIIMLAMGIHSFIMMLKNKEVKTVVVKSIITVTVFFLGLISLKGTERIVRNQIKFEPGVNKATPEFFFMMGQNDKYFGTVNSEDYENKWKFRAKYGEQANTKYLEKGFERIRNRGVWGNVKFYIKKLDVAYDDGCFSTQIQYDDSKVDKTNAVYKMYFNKDSKLYKLSSNIWQVLWNMILLSLMINTMLFCEKRAFCIDSFFEIVILGITFYLMIFENRAKYLFMFLPVYICYAGIIFKRITSSYKR